MTRLNLYFFGLLGLVLMTLTDCERNKDPLDPFSFYIYVGVFRIGEYTFPIATRIINGVEVLYAIGLVNFTANPDVTIEQLQPLVARFDGEILRFWELPSPIDPTKRELDVTMRIPFSLDPFEVADRLNRSPLIRFAEPVFIGTPEGP